MVSGARLLLQVLPGDFASRIIQMISLPVRDVPHNTNERSSQLVVIISDGHVLVCNVS